MGDAVDDKKLNFHEMELDDRLLKAIAKMGWMKPTLIQEVAIPLLLEGKDVLVRARTGSGKTAAFAIPVIQRILKSKLESKHQSIKALILSPSKELCGQITSVLDNLTEKCAREIKTLDISANGEMEVQKALLAEKPDIVVSTPSKALSHLKAKNMALRTSLETLIVDEADLIFSFGYEEEIKELLSYMPKLYQAVLASATLSEDVKNLKRLTQKSPVTLNLEEPEIDTTKLQHYQLMAEEDDKAAILYALLKLNLIRGKSIIFVRTVDRCYKLKLYLEQFKIAAGVLNSELPAAVRCLAVEQFNKNKFQIIVASDEYALDKPDGGLLMNKDENDDKKRQKSKRRKDKESGASRGIDFQNVSNVINFDFPLDVKSYVHRAGRTARGNNEGTVLSFVSIRERPLMDEVEEHLKSKVNNGRDVLQKYEFDLEQVEGFRYRSRDAWRAVTRIAVREARLKEIKQELINCKKLKGFFEENPAELGALRRDRALHTVKTGPGLEHLPDYLLPPALRPTNDDTTIEKSSEPARKKVKYNYTAPGTKKYNARSSNPLHSFSAKKEKMKRFPKIPHIAEIWVEATGRNDWILPSGSSL